MLKKFFRMLRSIPGKVGRNNSWNRIANKKGTRQRNIYIPYFKRLIFNILSLLTLVVNLYIIQPTLVQFTCTLFNQPCVQFTRRLSNHSLYRLPVHYTTHHCTIYLYIIPPTLVQFTCTLPANPCTVKASQYFSLAVHYPRPTLVQFTCTLSGQPLYSLSVSMLFIQCTAESLET